MGALADSQAYKDNPHHHLKHIIPLDFNSVQALPDSYVWAESGDTSPPPGARSTDRITVPLVDLMDPDALTTMIEACREWGIFQVIGHDIPEKLMREVEIEADRLFGLPVDQKMRALRTPRGATGYGLPRISPFFDKYMWFEGFTIMGSAMDHARRLWPHGYQGFCETMDDYQNQMKALTERLIRIIFKSLNINSGGMNWLKDGATNQSTALNLNSYPGCPDPTRAMGLAPHTDTSLVTVVHQFKSSGLQVFKDGFGWVPVQPVPGGFIVNVGDFLHLLSNGQFTSVRHRVTANQIPRLSVAYFYAPPADFLVSPALDQGQVPMYRNVTVKEYIDIKSKHLENALSLIQN